MKTLREYIRNHATGCHQLIGIVLLSHQHQFAFVLIFRTEFSLKRKVSHSQFGC